MAKIVVKSQIPQYTKQFNRHVRQNLDLAAMTLSRDISRSIKGSGQPGGRSGATKQQRAANRSQPWGPPHADTGHLKRNIGWDKPAGRPFVRRIGTSIGNKQSVGYAMWLEFGTRKMLPRPFLRPAIWRNRTKVRGIMSRPFRYRG